MAEFHVKAAPEGTEGEFSGVLSTYGNIDLVGDICEPGCFDEALKAHGPKYPLLYQHNADEPIGSFDVVSSDGALTVKGRINMGTQKGREAYALLKAGDIDGLSIGYSVPEDGYRWDDDGVRHLLKVDLREGSIVTFPANPLATAQAKSIMGRMADACKGMDAGTRAKALDALRDALSKSEDDGDDEGPKDPEEPKADEGADDAWEDVRGAVQDLLDALDRALGNGD